MSSTYNGVPANGTNPGGSSATIPADGDSLAVTSVNTALQKLADYIAFLGQPGRIRSMGVVRLDWLNATTQSGTFGGTTSIVTLVPTATPNSVAIATIGTDVTVSVTPHKLTANVTGTYRVWFTQGVYNNNANVVSLAFQKNGATSIPAFGDVGSISATANVMPYTVEAYMALTATDFVQIGFYGTNTQAYVITPHQAVGEQWFGMERVL